MSSGAVVDLESPATAVVCAESTGVSRTYSRIDITGSDLCPGMTDYKGLYTPECTSNEQCGVGEVCLCPLGFEAAHAPTGLYPAACVPASCTTSSDCSGHPCGMSSDQRAVPDGFYCRGDDDACESDLDCERGQLCNFNGARWACENHQPAE